MQSMPRDIYLPLYGRLEHGQSEDMAWDLYQSEPLSRLRDISLACTPSRYVPHGQAANRFQHSVGASVLARMVCDRIPELPRDLLVSSCLLHDSASPPFSHVAEPFLAYRTGMHHEQAVAKVLAPGSEVSELLDSYGVDSSQVLETICGQGPWGSLVAGSIDLDNLDNSLHLLISLGYTGKLPYKPQRLQQAFGFDEQGLFLELDDLMLSQLLGWRAARRELYNRLGSLVYLASTTMLYRALDLADKQGALPEHFFELDETSALVFLSESCSGSAYLLSLLERWRQQDCVMWRSNARQEDLRISGLYSDVLARRELADQMAAELSLQPEQLSFYAGRAKGHKAIELPFRGEERIVAAAQAAFSETQPRQLVAVFADKSAGLDPVRVEEVFDDLISALPEVTDSHCFF